MVLKQEFWKEWEQDVIAIFTLSLIELLKKKPLPEYENDINRLLSQIVRKVRKDWMKNNNKEIQGHPIYHAKGQPQEGETIKQTSENKEPEFTWGFTDAINDIDTNYHVECKRLCDTLSHYCSEYVVNGIMRFIEKEWSYGIGCESGLMIGYIQNSDHTSIFNSVNSYNKTNSVPNLILKGKWEIGTVSSLENSFDRPEIKISPFKLEHLWIDLR